ncbi:MAG: hypothetical protein HY855_17235 [Burkholderiales bacterium]|nr:hypothetical protein [Burkholderiales bacterium]
MYPTLDVTELDRLPREFFGGGRILPALVPACCVDMGLLATFQDHMQRAGETVQVHRMRYDRAYAFERIALGHSAADAVLRHVALMLFEIYQGGLLR